MAGKMAGFSKSRGTKAKKRVMAWRLLGIGLTLSGVIAYSSCGDFASFDVFKSGSQPSGVVVGLRAQLEDVRMKMDDHNYEAALEQLQPMLDDDQKDMNEARLLYAAAVLGDAGLEVWNLLSRVSEVANDQSRGQESGGLEAILDQFSDSLQGEGSAREVRIDALAAAIQILQTAPQPSAKEIKASTCLLAGILAVPTIADAKTGAATILSGLNDIKAEPSGVEGACSDLGRLDVGMALTTSVADHFNLVLEAMQGCSPLVLVEAQTLMAQVEKSLKKLVKNADLGCAAKPQCPSAFPACDQLFPACVQEVIKEGASGAIASDKVLSACEIALNCTFGGTCF